MTKPPARRPSPQDRPFEWNFISFPVLAAFSGGLFLGTLLVPIGGIVYTALSVFSLLGVSFSVAHAATRWMHNRALEKRIRRAEEDERERRALAARAAAARGNDVTARRRRGRGGSGGTPPVASP